MAPTEARRAHLHKRGDATRRIPAGASLFGRHGGDTGAVSRGHHQAQSRGLWAAGLFALVLAWRGLPAAALDPPTTLTIEAAAELRVGTRTSVPLVLHWQGARPVQVLVSAHAEGRALDVVKGRLLRADAIDPEANPLRFELPVVAAASGVALLNVTVLAYPCAFRCAAQRIEASRQILIREP